MEYIDSPIRLMPRPRALFHDNPEDVSPENSDNSSFEVPNTMAVSPAKSRVQVASPCSPPYRKVQALRYVLAENCSFSSFNFGTKNLLSIHVHRLFDTPSTPNTIIQKSAFERTKVPPKNIFHRSTDADYSERPVTYKIFNKKLENVDNTANVNPFTPDSGL